MSTSRLRGGHELMACTMGSLLGRYGAVVVVVRGRRHFFWGGDWEGRGGTSTGLRRSMWKFSARIIMKRMSFLHRISSMASDCLMQMLTRSALIDP